MDRISLAAGGTGVQRFAAIAGVIKALEDHNIQIDEAVTTSGSSLVLGIYRGGEYTAQQLINLILHTDYTQYGQVGLFRFLKAVFWSAAMNDGSKLEKDLLKWTKGRTLGEVPGLHITATDVTRGENRVLNSETEPDMTLARAIRASLSIPILWNGVEHRGGLLYDGGLVYNFPIDFLESRPGTPVVGVRIKPSFCKIEKKHSFRDVIGAVIANMVNGQDRKHIEDIRSGATWLEIDHGELDTGFASNEFKMSVEDKMAWIRRGYDAMTAFIEDSPSV